MTQASNFTIIGGGIAGLTTAIALRKAGITPVIFEAAPSLRPVGAGLALAANAMQAFQRLDIADKVVRQGRQLDAFTIFDERGEVINRTDSRALSQQYGIDNFTIHRADLHRVLLQELPPSSVQLGRRVSGVTQQPNRVIVHFEDGAEHHTDHLLVADGIHSPVRKQLVPGSSPRYAGYTCWRGVVHWQGPMNEASETWGSKGRVGLVPLRDNLVYWFACVNAPAADPSMRSMTAAKLAERFSHYHTPVPELIAQTPAETLIWNDIIDLMPLSQYAFGRILLLGDAAHATTPNMGQGACQAIEDAVILADELQKSPASEEAFRRFEQRRLPRTHYITQTSWRIGKMAQTANPLLIRLRNGLMKALPARLNQKQLEKLYKVDF